MNELTADERSRRRGWMARIVPIIRNPSNALPSLNDHYFVRWICNNEPSLRRWPAGVNSRRQDFFRRGLLSVSDTG